MSAFEGHTDIGARPGRLRRPPREAGLGNPSGASAPARPVLVVRRHALACVALLVLSICAAAVLLDVGAQPVRATHRHAPLTSHGLLSLPSSLQGPASQTLGAQDPAYRAVAIPGGLRVNNPAQPLSAAFTASSVTVHTGRLGLGLTLAAAGYGARPGAVRAATPTSRANRVTYDRGWIQEWYANGPVGLEQGFTVARPPVGAARGPLQLSLAITGGARASKLAGAKGIRFSGGHTSLVYGAPTATDAQGRPLHSWLQLHGRQLLLRVDTRGALFPVRIDPFIQRGSKMVAGEIGPGIMGETVSLSSDGNTALIGGPADNKERRRRMGLHPLGRRLVTAGRKAHRRGRDGERRLRLCRGALPGRQNGADRRLRRQRQASAPRGCSPAREKPGRRRAKSSPAPASRARAGSASPWRCPLKPIRR